MRLRWPPARMLRAMPCGITVSFVLALGLSPPARAQTSTMLTSPPEIAECLCLEWAVSTLSGEMEARKGAFEEKRREFEALDAEVAAARSRLNVENPNEVAAFRNLLDRRNAAQAELGDRLTPDYAASVAAYNRRVDAYNARCSGRTYEAQALAQTRADLSCPAP